MVDQPHHRFEPDAPDRRDAVVDEGIASRRAPPRWQFLVLVEVANFAVLRRHVGGPRADLLMIDLARRASAAAAGAVAKVVGRNLIEVSVQGAGRASLPELLAALDALADQPFDVDGELYPLELALGAGAVGVPHHDEVRLAEEAERALVQARAEHRPIARDVGSAAAEVDAIALARDLHGAAGRDELFLVYQPKIHLRRQQITSIEALIRWRHPVRGLVMPGDFIPIAEQSRTIAQMTLWTLRRVIADQQEMSAQGHDVVVFVNIAGALLADSRFVRRACALVQATGARLGFEITETSVIRDPESAIANLKIFADIGIVVAIDDYGAGLSSLAYLKQLPARELKIDKLFITQLTSSHRDPLIVRSTIDLAHALEMEVVAEGVETHAALALLSVMGCDMVQGYLISRPLTLEALLAYLAEDRHLQPEQDARTQFRRLASGWQR